MSNPTIVIVGSDAHTRAGLAEFGAFYKGREAGLQNNFRKI